LQRTYHELVRCFGRAGSRAAPGPAVAGSESRRASLSQRLWRFCSNPRVREVDLIEPLHHAAQQELQAHPHGVFLVVQDWSTLSFTTHGSKADRAAITHATHRGYELATALLVRAEDGAPIAPIDLCLTTADTVHSTRPTAPPTGVCHADQVLATMHATRELTAPAQVVHVIDREADSVGHWRQWAAAGFFALVRGDDRRVLHEGRASRLTRVAEELDERQAFRDAGKVTLRGRPGRLWVAETEVVLHRPARRWVTPDRQAEIAGPPLRLRLVVADVRGDDSRRQARWLLLTNAPTTFGDASAVARWYYFRWRIESFHKLLKSSGWQIEQWLQRDGSRLFKKLVVALGACVSVWALERREDAQSRSFQRLLMQLSGRQTKRARPVTTSGMLAGLWVLQAALGPLAELGPEKLEHLLATHLPAFAAPSRGP
jgi:hypothetical protein